jgi:hypothetical protein
MALCLRSRLQQPEPVPTDVPARLESLCKDVPILVPDNAFLPPQATVYFVFFSLPLRIKRAAPIQGEDS